MEDEDHGNYDEQDGAPAERNEEYTGSYGDSVGYGDFDGGKQRFPGPRGPRGGFMRGPRFVV